MMNHDKLFTFAPRTMNKKQNIKITVLGTGTSFGVPVIGCECEICTSVNPRDKRLRTSIKIESETTAIVVDTGPDFRQQMLASKTKKLDAVVFTHEHKDHIAGLDDIRAFNWIMKKPMEIYAEDRVQEAIKRELPYVFEATPYPGTPKLNLHAIGEEPMCIGDITIVPIRMYHYQLPVYGFRINDFAYLTDFKTMPDESLQKLEGIKYMLIEALQHKQHISHLSLPEALEYIEKLQPEKAWLTHINHTLGLHDRLNKTLPARVKLAFDGLNFKI